MEKTELILYSSMNDRDNRIRDLGNKVEEYTKIIPNKMKQFESGFFEKVEIID